MTKCFTCNGDIDRFGSPVEDLFCSQGCHIRFHKMEEKVRKALNGVDIATPTSNPTPLPSRRLPDTLQVDYQI